MPSCKGGRLTAFKGALGCGPRETRYSVTCLKVSKVKEGEKSGRERGERGGVPGKQPRWESHSASRQHCDLGKPEGAHL